MVSEIIEARERAQVTAPDAELRDWELRVTQRGLSEMEWDLVSTVPLGSLTKFEDGDTVGQFMGFRVIRDDTVTGFTIGPPAPPPPLLPPFLPWVEL